MFHEDFLSWVSSWSHSYRSASIGSSREAFRGLILFDGRNVDDLRAPFFDQCTFDRYGFSHFINEHVFSRLMIFDSHEHIDFVFFGDEADGVAGLCARDGALLMVRSAVSAFEEAPEVNHFAFYFDRLAFGLGERD